MGQPERRLFSARSLAPRRMTTKETENKVQHQEVEENNMAKPVKFAHVVYSTRRFEEMIDWYQKVFEAKVVYQNPVFAFLKQQLLAMPQGPSSAIPDAHGMS